MAFVRLALLLLLAGCGAQIEMPTRVSPTAAYLYSDTLNVVMGDGTLCAGHRPARAVDWTGQLSGCPHLWSYSVRGHSALSAPRMPLQLADENAVMPVVTVANPAGAVHRFAR